jgi:hypothetical protein
MNRVHHCPDTVIINSYMIDVQLENGEQVMFTHNYKLWWDPHVIALAKIKFLNLDGLYLNETRIITQIAHRKYSMRYHQARKAGDPSRL